MQLLQDTIEDKLIEVILRNVENNLYQATVGIIETDDINNVICQGRK